MIKRRNVKDHIRQARALLDQLEIAHTELLHTRVFELGRLLQLVGAGLKTHGEWLALHGLVAENAEAFGDERAVEAARLHAQAKKRLVPHGPH